MDEKKFIVDEVADRQNTRVIVCNHSDVCPVMQSKNPAPGMVFAAIVCDGEVMPPQFIESGLKVNTEEYLKIWIDVHLP